MYRKSFKYDKTCLKRQKKVIDSLDEIIIFICYFKLARLKDV